MNKDLTEVVFILDKSGSMSGREDDVIGGFNSTLKKQKKQKGECLISTVLFNDTSEVIHDRESISKIRNMTEDDFQTSGCTALIDALGDSIKYIKKVHKVIRKEDVPAHTLFIITTDGYENASHKYTSEEVKKMISKQQEKGWEFIYLAANIDAVETGKAFGFKKENMHNYLSDKLGNEALYDSVGEAICTVRRNVMLKESKCFDRVDADYARRSK